MFYLYNLPRETEWSVYIRIINDVINWTRYQFNVYLATPLAAELTRALSAFFFSS